MTTPGYLPGRTPPNRDAVRRAHLLILALILCASSLGAQPSKVAFDYRSELKLSHDAEVQARGDFNGDGVPDVIVAGSGHITVFEQGGSSFEWKLLHGPASARVPLVAACGRLNPDQRDDVVFLTGPRPLTAEIFLTGGGGIPVPSSTLELPGDFQQLTIADLDADRNADLLLYGKKTLGITTFAGNGRGGFTPGPVLFPDISVSQVVVSLLDGDDQPDIALVDWIGNRVDICSGFGNFVYSDPFVLEFDDEPIALAIGDLTGDRHRDIVLGFGEHPGFRVYAGDGSGNYSDTERSELTAAPEKIRVGDVDGDGRNDILMFLPAARSLVVRYQDGAGFFGSQQSYATGPSPHDVLFFQDSRRRFLNSAVLSSDDGVVRILHNRSIEFPGPAEWNFATGNDPVDVELADLNDDGWMDVVLTQASEPVLNLFLNDGKGNLNGQSTLVLPHAVTGLIPLVSSARERDFLGTGPDGATMTHISLNRGDLTVSPMTVTASGPAEALDARRSEEGGGRRIYAMVGGTGGRDAHLLAYDLIDRNRYEETDTRIAMPQRIVATTTHDSDRDGLRDLVLITVSDSGSEWTVTSYRQIADGFEFHGNITVGYPGTRSSGVSAWMADLNADGVDDLLLNLQKPDNILAVAIATGDTAFGDVEVIASDVRIPFRKSLLVTDFDSDGRVDLVFVNDRTRTVQFLPGDGTGRFAGPVNLTSSRGVRSFGIGDLNHDNENELILTVADEGVLSVTSFHHPLFERKKGKARE